MEMRLQYADLRPCLGFGLFQMAQTLFVRISERFDQFILGLLSGATGVGLYSVAFNIASIPVVHAMPAFAMPAATVLSRAATQKDGDQLARGYLLAVEIMMAINAAVSFGLLVVAPLLVTVVLGPKWHDIIPIVQWLSIVAVWQALYAFSGALIIATGASRLGLVWRVALTSALAIAAYLGAWAGGAVWLAAAMAGLLTVAVIPFYFFVVRRLIGPTAIKFAVAIGAPIVCAALMAITVAGAGVLMRPLMPAIAALSVEVVLGVIVYIILQALLRPSIVEEIAHIVPHEGLRGGLLGMLGHVNRLR
jgi:O-antigen/teichoic acid export membrane protein